MTGTNALLVQNALAAISGKWKLAVLCRLCSGPRRFGELLRDLPGIRHKVLTDQLRALETDGLIERSNFSQGSMLHVEYRCTPGGESLKPILAALGDWQWQNRNAETD